MCIGVLKDLSSHHTNALVYQRLQSFQEYSRLSLRILWFQPFFFLSLWQKCFIILICGVQVFVILSLQLKVQLPKGRVQHKWFLVTAAIGTQACFKNKEREGERTPGFGHPLEFCCKDCKIWLEAFMLNRLHPVYFCWSRKHSAPTKVRRGSSVPL